MKNLVPLDLVKLKTLAEDRGLTIPILMELLGERCFPAHVTPELKSRIWEQLKKRDPIVGEILNGIPTAKVIQIK